MAQKGSAAKDERSAASASPIQKNLARPSAEEIFTQVAKNARQELQRPSLALGLSGYGAGVFMGLSALGTAIAIGLLGHGTTAVVISRMFYPLGFIVVMLGRSQLFTENTLYPIALVLAEKREFWNTMRLWSVVLPMNVAGALTFAVLAAWTPGLQASTLHALADLGAEALRHPSTQIFWSGVFAGWMIALAAWLVSGSHSITGSVIIIWMLTFVVGLGNYAHCVASSCEILVTVLRGGATWHAYWWWFLLATGGNICGGVVMVTILEYGQVMHGKMVEAAAAEARREMAEE